MNLEHVFFIKNLLLAKSLSSVKICYNSFNIFITQNVHANAHL